MAKTSLGVRTTNVTTANACVEIIASAGAVSRVTEISFCLAGATASVFGIGFPAAIGITPTSPVTMVRHDQRDNTATTTVALAWGTGPTVPAAFLYRINMPATIGSVVSMTFPEGIVIPISKSLVIWNLSTTDVCDISISVSTAIPVGLVSSY